MRSHRIIPHRQSIAIEPKWAEAVVLMGFDSWTVPTLQNSYNYRVMLASDGVEAISLYDRHWENIAVILLDMMMPNLHTPYIIRALPQINPAVKVVVMSGTSKMNRSSSGMRAAHF